MRVNAIIDAREECKRLMARIDELEQAANFKDAVTGYGNIWGCPESAALRRASMDLSRALSKMRK